MLNNFNSLVNSIGVRHNDLYELTISYKKQHRNLIRIFKLLKWILRDVICVDILGVNYPENTRGKRFEINYFLLSVAFGFRVRVRLSISQNEIIPSVTSLFDSANWLEREVFDMYGVLFADHPDLRRILTDYGFAGYPLRKDFPIYGYLEFKYDYKTRNVKAFSTKLTQGFRNYNLANINPWIDDTFRILKSKL